MLLEGDCGFHTIAEAILDLLYLPLLSFPTSPPCAFPQLFSFGFCLLFAFRNRPEHSPSAAASLFFYYFRCAGAGGRSEWWRLLGTPLPEWSLTSSYFQTALLCFGRAHTHTKFQSARDREVP